VHRMRMPGVTHEYKSAATVCVTTHYPTHSSCRKASAGSILVGLLRSMHASEFYDMGSKKVGYVVLFVLVLCYPSQLTPPRPQEDHKDHAQPTRLAHPAHTVPAFTLAHPFTSDLGSPQRGAMPYSALNTIHPLWPFELTPEFSAVAQTAPAVFNLPLSSPQKFTAPRPPAPQCARFMSSAGHIMQAGEADATGRDPRSLVSSGSTQQCQSLCATAQ
jgi:hypothetical protein